MYSNRALSTRSGLRFLSNKVITVVSLLSTIGAFFSGCSDKRASYERSTYATSFNVALNKPATAQSNEGASQASMANDDSKNTYWGANPYPQWWQVDLQALYHLNQMVVRNYVDGRYYKYNIEASADGQSWTTIATKDNTNPAVDAGDSYAVNVAARYLRVNMLYNSANVGVHITDFKAFGEVDNQAAPSFNVIPNVQQWGAGSGVFALGSGSRICIDSAALQADATTLQEDIHIISGLNPPVQTCSPVSGDLLLTLSGADPSLAAEGYSLIIDDKVTIKANSLHGIFYGAQTLLQLLSQSADKRQVARGAATDFPKTAQRALMLDVARKFFDMNYLRKYVRLMAWHKLNSLHLHFSDDIAFRLESATYPGLAPATEKYTHEDIKSLVAFASKYHVAIVPEIETPSHCAALTNYFPHLLSKCASAGVPGLDLTKPETTQVIRALIDEFAPLFPGQYFHFGCDEYSHDEALDKCVPMTDYARSLGLERAGDLFYKWINDTAAYLISKGKVPRIWNGFDSMKSNIIIDKRVVIDSWNANMNALSRNGYSFFNASQYTLYLVPDVAVPTYWYPKFPGMYETWLPHMFDAEPSSGDLENASDPHLLGAQLNVWNDFGENVDYIDRITRVPLKTFAEKTWGGPTRSSFYSFWLDMQTVGEPPSNVNVMAWPPELPAVPAVPQVNLALNKSATASSSETPALTPAKAVDGNLATRWSSVSDDNQWIAVDLGSSQEVGRVVMRWEGAYGKAYKIQTSANGADWADRFSTAAGDGGEDEIVFSTVSARYVRMQGVKRGTGYGYSLWEFKVYRQ